MNGASRSPSEARPRGYPLEGHGPGVPGHFLNKNTIKSEGITTGEVLFPSAHIRGDAPSLAVARAA